VFQRSVAKSWLCDELQTNLTKGAMSPGYFQGGIAPIPATPGIGSALSAKFALILL